MAVVQSRASHWLNRAAIALALLMLVVSMIPLYWIGSTAFKPRAAAATVPPTVFFAPEITPFVKLFTSRVQQRGERDEAAYAKAPWWEQLVMDSGDRFIKDDKGNIEASGYVERFVNSIFIAVTSTFFAVALGTMTAYGFSRFKMPGEDDWLFFILSTRMLPPVVVAIPMFLMYRAVGLVDTHVGLIMTVRKASDGGPYRPHRSVLQLASPKCRAQEPQQERMFRYLLLRREPLRSIQSESHQSR